MPTAVAPLTHPNLAPRPRRWSRAEYHRLGELGFFRGQRVELIGGEVVVMSPMNDPHARGILLALDALRAAFPVGFTLRPQLPLVLGPADEPEPDVAVVPGGPREGTGHPTADLFVVEVADTTLAFDTTTKAELYATAGVPDYWVVDLESRRLLVFRDPQPLAAGLGATAYRTRLGLGPSDIVSPLAAPAAVIRVADLLP